MVYIILTCLFVILDRISKILALDKLKEIGSLPIVNNVFHLTYCENTGAAFSMFSKNTFLLSLFTLVFIMIIVYLMYRQLTCYKNKIIMISYSLILGGAIGNLIDRFYYGFVVDYFDFRLINFAIFNVADIFITIGGVLLIIYMLFNDDVKI